MFSIDVDPFKLYKLRKKANLLQSDVAALLGKSLLTYTKYEQGKTKIPKKDLETWRHLIKMAYFQKNINVS